MENGKDRQIFCFFIRMIGGCVSGCDIAETKTWNLDLHFRREARCRFPCGCAQSRRSGTAWQAVALLHIKSGSSLCALTAMMLRCVLIVRSRREIDICDSASLQPSVA